jgi:hypothetical protein
MRQELITPKILRKKPAERALTLRDGPGTPQQHEEAYERCCATDLHPGAVDRRPYAATLVQALS